MGLLARLRATPAPDSDFWYRPLGIPALSGVSVSADAALCLSAVWQAVRIISEGIAGLPCITYRRLPNGGKERATQHPLHDLLRWQPNTWQTAFEFWEMLVGHLLLRGNAYAQIVEGPRGFADQLIPLHPDRMEVSRDKSTGVLRYSYRLESGQTVAMPPDEVMHVRGLSQDGITGMSVIQYGAQSFGTAIASEQYAARFFGQGATAAFAAIHPGVLGEEGQKNLRESLSHYSSGLRNAHGILVLEEGMKIEQLGIKPEDAQLLASREFSVRDVARWFNVPVARLADAKTPTFASIEMFDLEFIMDTLRPIAVRIEQAIRRDLILAENAYFAEFLLEARLRGDSSSRANFYSRAINDGWMTPNEVRERENLNPLEGLDVILRPSTRRPINEEAEPVEEEPAEDEESEDADDAEAIAADVERTRAHLIVQEAAARLVRKEVAAATKAASRYASDARAWACWLDEFYTGHAAQVAENLKLPMPRAQDYAQRQAARLREGGVAVAQDWEWTVSLELARIALSEK